MNEIVLAVNYRPDTMVAHMREYEKKLGIKITFSVETEPLGTGKLRSNCSRSHSFSQGNSL